MMMFFAGIVLSLLGSLPPGLISLSVAHTALHRGFSAAMTLAVGAAAAEYFQAIVAVLLSEWFLQNKEWSRWFELIMVPVFLVLAIYFLFFAKPPRQHGDAVSVHRGRLFFQGILLSVFNLLAIPYWFVYVGWLRVNGWWEEQLSTMLIFALGVTLGTTMALGLYAYLSDQLLSRSALLAKWANKVIGLIFLGMAIKLLIG